MAAEMLRAIGVHSTQPKGIGNEEERLNKITLFGKIQTEQ